MTRDIEKELQTTFDLASRRYDAKKIAELKQREAEQRRDVSGAERDAGRHWQALQETEAKFEKERMLERQDYQDNFESRMDAARQIVQREATKAAPRCARLTL